MSKHFEDDTGSTMQGDVAMGDPVIFLPKHLLDAVLALEEDKGIPIGTSLKAIRVYALDGIGPEQLPHILSSYLLADAAIQKHQPQLIGADPLPLQIPYEEWMDENRVRKALKDSSKRKIFGRG